MIDIKKLKENAEPRNFTLDENEGMTWSHVRMARIIATIIHAANDCQEKCKYCGDRLYVGEAVATVLNTDPIFMAERPEKVSEYGYLGTLNGVIKVYLAPELEKNECLMGHHGRAALAEQDFFFLLKYEGLELVDFIEQSERQQADPKWILQGVKGYICGTSDGIEFAEEMREPDHDVQAKTGFSLIEQSIERAKSICEADGEALAKYYEENWDADKIMEMAHGPNAD